MRIPQWSNKTRFYAAVYFVAVFFLVFIYGDRSGFVKDSQRTVNFEMFKGFKYYLRKFKHRNEFLLYDNEIAFAFQEFAGNILLFFPLPLMLSFLFKKRLSFLAVMAGILGTTFFIEITQFVFNIGTFDVDDLFLNTIGGVLGIIAFRKKILKKKIN